MLPTGTVTFFFSDLEASTRLWEAHPESMRAALARHDALLREAVEAHGGAVVKKTGDGLHAAFASAVAAARAAVAVQQALQAEPWGDAGPLRARVALHTGEAELRDGDYYGPAVNRAARLMAAAHGGQILLSAATAALLHGKAQLVDLGEHRLRDLAGAEHVFQLVSPGLRSDFPPIASLATHAHNLPVQLTSFVGRQREMAEVKRLLPAARLLTLTGPGGTGKTRLALQVAADLLGDFAGGAWLVELATLSDPSLVEQSVAAALGIHQQPGRPLDEVLVDYLRDKRLLLLLDNCEHLNDACARLADRLLRACPLLAIMVSSREALSIAGEVTFQVPSLQIPEPEEPLDAASLLEYEAIRLFVERAQAARPDFRLAGDNAPAVIQICRRLDGIPLAIELAAARIRVLPAGQIAARLNDRFRLLTGGSRTALPRQQTLQALVDWSWDLLPEPERVLLRRLSVFAGGWTLEAAEAVAGSDATDREPLDVLEGLAQLVAKSLVVAGEEGRYHFLETFRQYARDRLWEAGEGEALRDRHAGFFLALALEAEPHLTGRDMVSWLGRLDAERDNLRAALDWTLEDRPETALRLVAALQFYWLRRADTTEARRRLDQVLEQDRLHRIPDTPDYQEARARVLATLAQTLTDQGENAAAIAAATEAVRLAQRSGRPRILAHALAMLALSNTYGGGVEAALPIARESLAVSRPHGFALEIIMALSALVGPVLYRSPDVAAVAAARGHLEEIERLARAEGDLWDMALATMSLGRMAALEGQPAAAQARYEQAGAHFRQVGDEHFETVALSELAHALRHGGRLDQAEAIYRLTLKHWQRIGHRAAVAHQLECVAMLALARGSDATRATRAARLLGTAEALREAAGSGRVRDEQAEYEAALAALRTHLDEDALAAALAGGRAMPLDQAVAYALETP